MTTPNPIRPGIGNANSFLTSGIPYISGAVIAGGGSLNGQVRFSFPRIARQVTVINKSSNDIRVHFNSLSDGNVIDGRHYITLDDADDSITFTTKCKEIYVSSISGTNGSVEVYADITSVPAVDMYVLSGSGLTE